MALRQNAIKERNSLRTSRICKLFLSFFIASLCREYSPSKTPLHCDVLKAGEEGENEAWFKFKEEATQHKSEIEERTAFYTTTLCIRQASARWMQKVALYIIMRVVWVYALQKPRWSTTFLEFYFSHEYEYLIGFKRLGSVRVASSCSSGPFKGGINNMQ